MAGNDASATGIPKTSRRAKQATRKLEDLVRQYVAEGMSEDLAREKALATMRDNGRGDWRAS